MKSSALHHDLGVPSGHDKLGITTYGYIMVLGFVNTTSSRVLFIGVSCDTFMSVYQIFKIVSLIHSLRLVIEFGLIRPFYNVFL